MKIKKDQRRKWGKRIFAWEIFACLTFFLFVTNADLVKAESGYLTGLVNGDDGSNLTFQSAGFAIYNPENTGTIVFSANIGQDNESDHFSFIFGEEEDERMELETINASRISECGLVMWALSDMDKDFMEGKNAFYPVGNPVQNDTVAINYLASSGDGLGIKSQEAILKGMEMTQVEDIEVGVLEVDGLPNDIALYPAVLMDGSGNCVGMVTDKGVITLSGDEEKFYAGSSGGSGSDGGSGDGSGNDGGSDGSGSSDNGGELTKRRDDDIQNKDTDSNEYMQYIMIAAAGVVIVLVGIIVFLARKKKPDAQAGQNFNGGAAGPVQGYGGPTAPAQGYGEPTTPARGYAGVTRPLQDYGNVDFEQRAGMPETKPACCLVGTGGYMDGRKYPFAGKEITIGRYNTNVIRYPENAPGVSRSHAKLYMDGGRLMLMDCNSSSGTFLKRMGKLQPMLPVEVKIGDVFYIGEKRNGFIIQK